MNVKEIVVTLLAIIGALSICNYIVVTAPQLVNFMFWVMIFLISAASYNHFANKKRNKDKGNE
ncbi:membrane-bound protein [Bacillus phage vB_BthM-Goe5]|nr:membrane-bound protein [Bacillus phage vB_BthM-Goe5]